MTLAAALLVGLCAGTHTATWGMYKDAPHEGFTWYKYLRSILISGALAPILFLAGLVTGTGAGAFLLLFGLTYVLERALNEFYKTFLRQEDQSKYFIPMQFAVRGRVVQSARYRWLIGAAVALAVLGLSALVRALQPVAGERPPLLMFALAGGLAGLVSALGGAWKDAPHEGFETFKFFRSPSFAAAYTLLLSAFTSSLVLAGLAGLGFTIATLETYKTFFFPSKPRGKFAGKPVHFPRMLAHRNWFVPVYVGIWIWLISGFALAFR